MNKFTQISVIFCLAILAAPGLAQSNSLYRRASDEVLARKVRGGKMAENAGSEMPFNSEGGRIAVSRLTAMQSSWITVDEPTPKDFRVHDLITIVVNEVSKNTTKSQLKAEREYDFNTQLKDWFTWKDNAIQAADKAGGTPKVSFNYNREFDGKGDAKREDSLTLRIQAEIIDVLPNGNLRLEASKMVKIDEEESSMTLTGVIRSKDIGIDNTVLSTQVADLKVAKQNKGQVRDATRRGVISGFLDKINLF